jgi:predicted thioesterase
MGRLSGHLTARSLPPALPAVFQGFNQMPKVLATPFVVAFIEWTCIEGLREHLGAGDVICRDEKDVIAKGQHERFVVDVSRFEKALAEKRGGQFG